MRICVEYFFGTYALLINLFLLAFGNNSRRIYMTPFQFNCLNGGNTSATTNSNGVPVTNNPTPAAVLPIFRRKRFAGRVSYQQDTPAPPSDSVKDRSTCSWRIVQDFDSARIPNTMPKAICNQDSCNYSFLEEYRNSNDNFPYFLSVMQVKTECAIIYELKQIQREYCDNGTYSCTTEHVQWPVACTCALKRIRTVTPSTMN